MLAIRTRLKLCARVAASCAALALLLPSGSCLAQAAPQNTSSDWDHGFAEYVYVVNDYTSNNVSIFSVDLDTGKLTPAPDSPFNPGNLFSGINEAEGQVTVDHTGRFVYLANPQIPDISQVLGYSIDPNNGDLSSLSDSPYPAAFSAVAIAIEPRNRFAYVTSGPITGYSIDQASGNLTQLPDSPFAGPSQPSQMAFDASGQFAYEGAGGPVWGFSIDQKTGALAPLSGSPFTGGNELIGIAVDPTGPFLYATTQYGPGYAPDGTIIGYRIDPHTGNLNEFSSSPVTLPPGGVQAPIIDPTGRFLYVPMIQDQEVVGYSINPFNGELSPLPHSPFPSPGEAWSMAFDPSGHFAFVGVQDTSGNGGVAAYRFNPLNGDLTEVHGSPFPAGSESYSIAVALTATHR